MCPARAHGLLEPHRPTRRLRGVAAALALLAATYAVALALLSRPAVEARLRARIEEALRTRLGEVVLGPDVHVDPLLRVTFGPVEVPGARRGDPPPVTVERVKVRPRLSALLAGRVEPSSVGLLGVRVVPGREGAALRALVERVRRTRSRQAPASARRAGEPDGETDRPAPNPTVHVRGLVVVLDVRGADVEVGPLDLTLAGSREADRLGLDLVFPSGATGELALRREGGGWRARATATGLGPEDVPAALRGGAAELARGRVSLEASAEAPEGLARATGRVRVVADGVSLAGERIAAEPVGPLSAVVEGALAWDGAERRLRLERGRVTFQGVLEVSVSGEARLGPGVPFSLAARAEGVELGALVAALPPALAPPPGAPRPAGPLDARLELSGPLLVPAAWAIDAGLDLARLREAARRGAPDALRGPFTYTPEVESGRAPAIVVGPQNPDFVPVAELPVHVVRAVTASEDAGFFAHEGFDFQELRNAFAQGAEAGRVVRGGSTITQQLAKNLFLSREKTLARKVREAVLTVALEAAVPKARLLEIYLNVAEWGPRLWGIGPAARHWFGKDARALTPREAAFLATVIPNPVRYHVMWDRGATTEAWDERVNELLLKMAGQGAISEDALLAALDERLAFARPEAAVRPETVVQPEP